MKAPPIQDSDLNLICQTLARHPEITAAKLFGSRAKGTHNKHSDVDLAIWGVDHPLRAEAILAELEELPLPFRFDLLCFECIQNVALREHIQRVGIPILDRQSKPTA